MRPDTVGAGIAADPGPDGASTRPTPPCLDLTRSYSAARKYGYTHSLALLRSRGRPSPLHNAPRKRSALPAGPTERGGPPPLLGLSPGLCGPSRTVANFTDRTVPRRPERIRHASADSPRIMRPHFSPCQAPKSPRAGPIQPIHFSRRAAETRRCRRYCGIDLSGSARLPLPASPETPVVFSAGSASLREQLQRFGSVTPIRARRRAAPRSPASGRGGSGPAG